VIHEQHQRGVRTTATYDISGPGALSTNLSPLPAEPLTVATYLAALESSHSPSTIRRRLAAISLSHQLAAEVAELGLTKGTRVTVEGLWSKRTSTTKAGELRINDVLTVNKIRLFTETEISRPDVVEGEGEYDEATPEPSDLRESAA
jgi:hypothetical protein